MNDSEYKPDDDFSRSIEECYAEVRQRIRDGGEGWVQKPYTKHNFGHTWTAEQNQKFIAHWESGMKCPEISKVMGIPRHNVESHRDYLRRAGKIEARKKMWGGDRPRVAEMWSEGRNIQQIAAELHRSKASVQAQLRHMGFQDEIGSEDRGIRKKLKAANIAFVCRLLKFHPELETRL